MLSISLVTLGDPGQLTGGYLYHRRMADAAADHDAALRFVSFPTGPFPTPGLWGRRIWREAAGGADVVLVDSIAAAFLGPWVGLVRAPAPPVPLAAIVHQPPGGIDHGPARTALQARLDRRLYRAADLIVAASDALADAYRAKGFAADRIAVVPPGRDVAAPASPGGRAEPASPGDRVSPGEPAAPASPGGSGRAEPASPGDRVSPAEPVSPASPEERVSPAETAVPASPSGRADPAFPARADLRAGRRAALLCVGNWVERKGILPLLDAVAGLAPGAATLHLVGRDDVDPAYAGRVRARLARPDLAGRVTVHGPVSRERVAGFYAAADVFVLASTKEPYGTVYGEAMAAGLPVVGWRSGNLPHLAADGREGLVVPTGDVAGLRAALDRLANDEPYRTHLAAAARARAETFPTWAESAARLFGLLRDLA